MGDLLGRCWPKAFTDINSQVFQVTRIGHYVSSEKAQRELGYRPQPIVEALDAAIEWFQGQKMLATTDQAA
jgi:nucleoside-diphosphate-sugar epimerase